MKNYYGRFSSKNYGPLVSGKVLLVGPDEFDQIVKSRELTLTLDNDGVIHSGKSVMVKVEQKENNVWSSPAFPSQRISVWITKETDTKLHGIYQAKHPHDTGRFKIYKDKVLNDPSSKCTIQ